MLAGTDTQLEIDVGVVRNTIGKIIFSKKENYTTSLAGDQMYGWIKGEWKEHVIKGDILVVFHAEQALKFFVRIEKIQNYPICAGGFEKKITETGTYLTLLPLLEIDYEEEYTGTPRPHDLANFELGFPSPKELAQINHIPSEGLPLGEIVGHGIRTPFYYPIIPEDTRFQSWLISGVQGKGKSVFAKLLVASVTSKTNDSIVILDREGEYKNFPDLNNMTDVGKKFFKKHGIKPVKPRILKLSNSIFEATASMSMKGINLRDVLSLMPELETKSAEVARTIMSKACSTISENGSELTWNNLRREIFEELNHSQFLSGMAGAQIRGAIERAMMSQNLDLFDQNGRTPLIPEKLFIEKTVTIIDIQDLSPAQQRMAALYMFLMLYKHKFQDNVKDPGVLVFFDESEFLFPRHPGNSEKDYVNRIAEMIRDPVRRGRKHKFGLVWITHEIADLDQSVTNLCNTKVIFGSTVVHGSKTWFKDNIGEQFINEIGTLPVGQCIIDARKTAIPISVKLHVPFVGSKEDYFGEL